MLPSVRGMTCAAVFAATESTPMLCVAFCKIPENYLEKESLLPDTVPLEKEGREGTLLIRGA